MVTESSGACRSNYALLIWNMSHVHVRKLKYQFHDYPEGLGQLSRAFAYKTVADLHIRILHLNWIIIVLFFLLLPLLSLM